MSSAISLWSCAASCQDQVEREVVGLYRGDEPILVSRPWCGPSGVPALQVANRRLFPLLSSLISVADYHAHEGAWYGEIATDWHVVAAISGMSRNTVGTSLQELMRDGFVHYNPAWGRVSPALIRIFPYNAKTGLRVFQVEDSWLRAFIVNVEPRVALFDATTEGKSVEFVPISAPKPMRFMAASISNAPVFMSKSAQHEPKVRARAEHEEIAHTFLMKLEGVAGFEDIYTLSAGLNPIIKSNPFPTSPGSGLVLGKEATDWRSNCWSQGGVEIKFVDEESTPAAEDLGVKTSWSIAPDQESSTARALTEGSWPKTENDYNDHDALINKVVVATSPTSGLMPTGACAPTAPPAAAPPAASAPFLRRSSVRQLLPGQVEAIYQIRGRRISDGVRSALTTNVVSCIETYERLGGVPFCERDLPFLERALTLTSHRYVLSGIRDTSRYPDNNPGYFLVRDGMSHVFNYIEKTSAKHSKARSRKDRTSSGMTADLAKKIRARRQKGIAADKAAVSAPAPAPAPAPIVAPGSGMVSENSPAAAEPAKGKVWPV